MSPTDPPTQPGDEPTVEETPTHEELTHRVEILREALEGLAGEVTRLLKSPTVNAQSWLLVDNVDEARDMVGDLIPWLDAVYLRFEGVRLPDCWTRHPSIVEELLALRGAHAEALGGLGWGTRMVTWLNVYRPQVVARIESKIGGCGLSRHVSAGPPPLTAPGAAYLDAIAEHWVTHGVTPAPTEQELQQAREYSDRLDDDLLDRPSS